MEAAGLAFGIVATVDLCLKYGSIMMDLCKTYRNAEAQFSERLVEVKDIWQRTSLQLTFLRSISGELQADFREVQNEKLLILANKLTVVITRLESLRIAKNEGTLRRLNFAVRKDNLDNVIQELSDWQGRFDPSWLLLLRLSSSMVDNQLQNNAIGQHDSKSAIQFRKLAKDQPLGDHERPHVSLRLIELESTPIEHSTARCVHQANSDGWFIADNVPCFTKPHEQLVRKNTRALAQKLSCRDPESFGLLKCKGFAPSSQRSMEARSSFDLLFHMPEGVKGQPFSLRAALMNPPKHTLTDRMLLARQLARAVSYVHTLGFVHKNIRPETIIGFAIANDSVDHFFLVGFEQPRLADGQTIMRGDNKWFKNLYRHPNRQGLVPEESFVMQHDMCSLGVCLLEIGIWASLVVYNGDNVTPLPNTFLGISSNQPEKDAPLEVKARFVQLAREKLPGLMGNVYSRVVHDCLTCLDDDNDDFGDESEFLDEDGVLVRVRYIEKVLMKLDEILV